MKTVFCILLWVLLAVLDLCGQGFGQSLAFQGAAGIRPAAGGGGESCPADGSPDLGVAPANDDEDNFSWTTDRVFAGQKNFSDASTRTICKIGCYLAVGAGTVTGKKYRVAIYTTSGDNLGSVIANGYSDEVSGPSSAGWVYFNWSGSKPTITGGTSYHITVTVYNSGTTTVASVDASNRAVLWGETPSSEIAGSKAVWNSAGVIDVDSTTYDADLRFYWYD